MTNGIEIVQRLDSKRGPGNTVERNPDYQPDNSCDHGVPMDDACTKCEEENEDVIGEGEEARS